MLRNDKCTRQQLRVATQLQLCYSIKMAPRLKRISDPDRLGTCVENRNLE
jgi:hypothetical protein